MREEFGVDPPTHSVKLFEMEETSSLVFKWTLGICCGIGVLLLVILLPLSFSYIEWDEFGLKKGTTTNEIFYGEVYDTGRYYWGVGYTSITFQNTIQNVDFTDNGDGDLSIFTTGGLQIFIGCTFQFIIPKDQVPFILQQFGYNYINEVKSVARSSLKNVAPQFSSQDYYDNRPTISQAFFDAISNDLMNNVHVQLVFFQLQDIELSSELQNQVLETLVQEQTNAQELYVQNSTVIRQETSTQEQQILSEITRMEGNITSQINVITQSAVATAFLQVQEANRNGQRDMFQALGLNSTELQLSFLYVTGLASSVGTKYLVGLDNAQVNLNT